MSVSDDLFSAFRTALSTIWPEVVANGIWSTEEAIRQSFDEATQNLVVPYAVIDVGGLVPSEDYGIATRVWEVPVMAYYVAEVQDGDTEALRGRLEALADYLWTGDLSRGRLIPGNPRVGWGQDNLPNSMLMLMNATQWCGTVAVNCVVWEPPAGFA